MPPRALLARLSPIVVVAALVGTSSAHANPVQAENERSGTGAWSFAQPREPGAIEGYASRVSARPGELVGFHVRTSPSERYRVELYRLGWYAGAGGRRIACSPSCSGDEPGVSQPSPPAPDASTGEVDAGWSVTDRIRIPADAASGYYLAKFVLTSGPAAGQARAYPVIVRSSQPHRASILVQVPINTWQAYNSWGGKSLYSSNSTDGVPATHVSFNRPFVGLQLFREELQLMRFLEREGYDVSYQTDVDSNRNPRALAAHQLVMTAGHGEYWSKAERDGFERARDLGTNLTFMGANTAYWQVRYENHERTLVGYKSDADPIANPSLKTVRFRDLQPPRPECELLGVQWQGGSYGAGQPVPSYAVAPGAEGDPYLRGTGLVAGSVLQGLVGHEWDGVEPGCSVPTPRSSSTTTASMPRTRSGTSRPLARGCSASGASTSRGASTATPTRTWSETGRSAPHRPIRACRPSCGMLWQIWLRPPRPRSIAPHLRSASWLPARCGCAACSPRASGSGSDAPRAAASRPGC